MTVKIKVWAIIIIKKKDKQHCNGANNKNFKEVKINNNLKIFCSMLRKHTHTKKLLEVRKGKLVISIKKI